MARRTISPLQIVLLALLAGMVVLLLRTRDSGNGVGPRAAAPPAFPTNGVQEISFRRGAIMVRVVREQDGYWIVEPYRDRASDEMIAQSLKVAATLEPLRILPDTAGAPFGLDPPSAAWTCRWAGGEYSVALGDSIPAGGGRYARRTGSRQVMVVDPFLARRFLAPPVQDIHSMIACPVGVGPIDTVKVETREEKIVIVRRRADLWEIVAPIHAEAAAAEITRAVQSLRTGTMREVLGPVAGFDLRALGLEPPRARWTLVQGATQWTVRIGHPTSDERNVRLVPAGRQVVGLIDSESFRGWVDGSPRLRESRMLWAAGDSVESIAVRKGPIRRAFIKDPHRGWQEVTAAETLAVRQDAFSQAVQNLCALRAVSFAAPTVTAETSSTLAIQLRTARGGRDSLLLAPPRGGAGAAMAPRQPGSCLVSETPYRTWTLWLDRPLRP